MRSVRKIFDALESHDEGLPASSPSRPLRPSVSHLLSPRRSRRRGNRPAGLRDHRRRPGGGLTQQTFLQEPDGQIWVVGESAPVGGVLVALQRPR